MSKSSSAREKADLRHLTQVRALTSEVAAAISAIGHNDLRRLQVAVANQEQISSELATAKWTPTALPKKAGVTSEIAGQIQEAYVALAQLNRVYAGVLKRSKRSAELLSAIYCTGGDGYRMAPQCSGDSQIVSCEV